MLLEKLYRSPPERMQESNVAKNWNKRTAVVKIVVDKSHNVMRNYRDIDLSIIHSIVFKASWVRLIV